MNPNDDEFQEALSDLANALQTAWPLASRQRHVLGDLAREVRGMLDGAIEAAVTDGLLFA